MVRSAEWGCPVAVAVPSEELHFPGDRGEETISEGWVFLFGKDVLEGTVERFGGEESRCVCRGVIRGEKLVIWR